MPITQRMVARFNARPPSTHVKELNETTSDGEAKLLVQELLEAGPLVRAHQTHSQVTTVLETIRSEPLMLSTPTTQKPSTPTKTQHSIASANHDFDRLPGMTHPLLIETHRDSSRLASGVRPAVADGVGSFGYAHVRLCAIRLPSGSCLGTELASRQLSERSRMA